MSKTKRQIIKDISNETSLNLELDDSYKYEKISGISASISNLALKKIDLSKIRQSGIKVIKPKILIQNKRTNLGIDESYSDQSSDENDTLTKVI